MGRAVLFLSALVLGAYFVAFATVFLSNLIMEIVQAPNDIQYFVMLHHFDQLFALFFWYIFPVLLIGFALVGLFGRGSPLYFAVVGMIAAVLPIIVLSLSGPSSDELRWGALMSVSGGFVAALFGLLFGKQIQHFFVTSGE